VFGQTAAGEILTVAEKLELGVQTFWEYVLLFLGMTLGLVSIPFGFPGTLIIMGCVLVYALVTHFAGAIGVPFFVFLCMLTLVAETADNWLSAIGAKRYGASTRSMWLSFVGGLVGAIVIGGPLTVALGPLGPVVGGFAGAFAIVVVHELYLHGNFRDALRAGWGTFLGRMAGMVLKLVISIAIIASVAAAILL
jgi:uncharacterized protein YqgC (DUF456 family)